MEYSVTYRSQLKAYYIKKHTPNNNTIANLDL